jgi:hypothetical protein
MAQSLQILDYDPDKWGSTPGRENDGIFSLHNHIQTVSGAHPASYPMETGDSSGHDGDYSPPSSEEVKNVWSYTSTPPICLHSMVLN